MYKYFAERRKMAQIVCVPSEDMLSYRMRVEGEMLKMGASTSDLNLIRDPMISNAIKNHRNPEDVAWAILQ